MKVPFHCILCPTDLSAIGNLAVPVAYRLAGQHAVVHLAHVCEPPFLGNPLYTQFVQGYVPTPEDVEAGEERVRLALHRLPPDDAIERGIRTEYHLPHDVSAADAIEALAHEVGADVVILGTHGRTGLSRLMMGSVAADVVKKEGLPVILVGHVTKDGQIAGPRVLEHMVDTVLYFEGDRGHQFRILRAVKNRFGATDEIGVFEMTDAGLAQVSDPSALFLGDRDEAATGASVFAGLEGSRPLLVEVQALVSPSPLATPRRAVVGWDTGRLAMVLAVLDTRCALQLGTHDVYLNVAGGLKITDPAADLAAAAALVSSFCGVALPAGNIYFGEVSLSGAIRPVGHMSGRLKEAEKLGFTAATVPAKLGEDTGGTGLQLDTIAHLSDLTARLAPPERA